MKKSVELCFDIGSPAAYIAWHVIPKIARAAGAELIHTPVLLGGVFKAQGNRSPAEVPAKSAWFRRDLQRWAGLYGLEYVRNDTFPQNTLVHMRGAVALQDTDTFVPYVEGFLEALHVKNQVISDETVVGEVLGRIGLDPAAFMTRTQDPEVKERLKANTERAVARGMFGAPTFFVGDAMHFGQDRMWMVAEDLGVNLHEAVGDSG